MTDKSKDTLEFLDDLALLVDEDPHALNKHAELLADSEQYRDLRHEVRLLAEKLSDVGSDFLSPADLQTKIIETIDARAPSKPAYKPSARDAATSRETLSQGAGPVSLERSEARSGSVGSGSIKSTQTDDGNIKSSAVVTKKSTGDTPTRPRLRAAVAESRRRPAWFWTALVLAILVFVVGALYRDLWQKKTKPSSSHLVKPAPVNTLTARIAKLFCDGNAGQLGEERAAGSELRVGALFRAGEEIKTDRLSRVLLELSDGSRLILNRDTAIALSPHVERQVEMRFGELLAEIAGGSKRRGTTFSTPVGGVDVVGTKFDMSVTSTAVNIRVIRGTVTLKPSGNQQVEITAGEEGLMTKDAPARIAPLVEVARVVSWSDLQEPGTREKNRGLGELGASKPGEEGTREHPLELVKHRVTARIVGPTARTEIEETFRNDGTETLQGIYRFSLPPDARVAAISLQVDGKWQQGAVVERERAREIWRQVTRQAAPEQKRTSEEELIWAPGPWRDPALLEWQSNGRLELRIFPIPAKGEKSIRLAYTQTLAPGSSGRRYLYPLPHASGDAIKVGRFEVDIEVVGVRSENTRVYGYALRDTALAENTVLVYDQDAFSPSGDLVVEYELPDDQEEIRWWSYRGAAVAAPTKVRQSKRDEQVEREWRAIRADDRGYIALALRPDLPAWRSTRSRDYVFILDSSQSMIGERLVRSCDLAQRMISEMDREDRVLLMTCDLTCRPMAADLLSPSKETERRVKTWLAQITPAGSSDLVAAIRFAKASIEKKMQPERDVRLIYLGDGVASVGHRKTPSLVTEAKLIAADPRVTITTIGVGYDADALALTSLARAGRGHYLPYIPGQRASDAALTALETTYGAALEYPTLEMPDGIEQIAPQQLPTIRAGQEIMIVGRLSKKQVNGTVILSGSIGNHRFNRRYPVSITASSSPANAIVSNWWASTYIDDLQLSGSAEVFARIIALSRAYGVMSRYTSLLVLENEAIFQPFGVKQAPNPLQWTGADELETEQANAEDDAESAFSTLTAAEAEAVLAGGASDSILQGGERTRKKGESKTASEARSLGVSVDSDFGDESAPAETADAKQKTVGQGKRVGRGRESGRWMKKIWVREALILKAAHASSDDLYQADEATEALDQKPDSRDRYRELVRVLCRIGNLERARSTVEQWLERDRLDPEAIVYLSNVMGRQGLRDDALRYLSGIVDLLPDDTVFHERMAGAFERAEMFDNACAHRVALAEMVPGDINAVAAAVRCERAFGRDQQAIGLLNALPKQTLRQEVEEKAAQTAEPEPMKGELLLSASWKPKEDIDLSLITPQGARVSWMGGRSTAVSAKASALDQEILGLERASAGRYMLEASRIKPNAVSPINGIMKVEVLGIKHEFNFSLSSERTPVGRIVVRRRARLVPR